MRARTTFVSFVLLALLAGCASRAPVAPKLPPPVELATLGPGDVIDVLVYDEASMSKPFKVAPDGTIDFPLAGTIEVEGLEPQVVARLLRDRLREKKILKDPQVSIFVKEVNSKKFSVLGQVAKPGQFPMADGMTLLQAISVAGGFTPLADTDHVTLQRRVSKTKTVRVVISADAMIKGKISDVPLQSGDTIWVDQGII